MGPRSSLLAGLLAGAMLAGAGPVAAQGLSSALNVVVENGTGGDADIEVVDNVCQVVVLSKRVVADGEVPAQVCAGDLGRGDVTLRDRLAGSERRFDNVQDGDRLPVPTR